MLESLSDISSHDGILSFVKTEDTYKMLLLNVTRTNINARQCQKEGFCTDLVNVN